MNVTFTVPLELRPKARPRVTREGRAYTPSRTRTWEAQFALVARAYLPRTILDEPLRVDLLFVLPRPARLMRKKDPDGLVWAPFRPDRDNMEKAVLDALKTSWRDDAQVVCGESLKCYAEKTGCPRVVCRIQSADWEPGPDAASLGLLASPVASVGGAA